MRGQLQVIGYCLNIVNDAISDFNQSLLGRNVLANYRLFIALLRVKVIEILHTPCKRKKFSQR